MDYNEIFRVRTKQLAIKIIQLFSGLVYSDEVAVIRKQIIKSATSVAANYRAMSRARSEKERFAKLSIVVEEIDETLFWLELVEDIHMLPPEQLSWVKDESRRNFKSNRCLQKIFINQIITHHPSFITHKNICISF